MCNVMVADKLLLIDGDGLLYRCGFATEKTRYCVTIGTTDVPPLFADSSKEATKIAEDSPYAADCFIWSRKEIEPVENALSLLKHTLDRIIGKYNEYSCRIILTPSVGNFRDRIATVAKYKGNRDGASRPKHYKALAEYTTDVYGGYFATGCEADDAIATIAAARPLDSYVVVSLDKDLDQIPGKHYNWVKEEEYTIGKKEGTLNLYAQILSGDPTDNIPGIEGIGPKTAHKMLEACTGVRSCWETVLNAYRSKYSPAGAVRDASGVDVDEGYRRATEMARLVYLQQKEGELWEPPT